MANQNSTQYANTQTVPATMNDVCDEHGRVRVRAFDFTQSGAGADGDTVTLCQLPAGTVRILGVQIVNSALGASRVIKVGHTGYTNLSNTAVAADDDAFLVNTSVASAGSINGVASSKLSSKTGLTVRATITGGTIPDAATLNGQILYTLD